MLGTGVEANQPEFAALAKVLGALGVLVLAVAHGNKAAAQRGGRPELHDVAYTQALGSLAQTAIVVHYPTADKNLIEVSCARAPETEFPAFRLRWTDTRGTYADAGSGLACGVEGIPSAAPTKADTAEDKRTGIAKSVVAFLTARPNQSANAIVAASRGGRPLEKRQVLDELITAGVVIDGLGKVHRGDFVPTYCVAPSSPANYEARAKWGL
jgi:hypothetical protein